MRTKHRISGSLHSYQVEAVDAHLHTLEFVLRNIDLELSHLGDMNIIVEPGHSIIWPPTTVSTSWRDISLDIAAGRVRLDQTNIPVDHRFSDSDAKSMLLTLFKRDPLAYLYHVYCYAR